MSRVLCMSVLLFAVQYDVTGVNRALRDLEQRKYEARLFVLC